MAFYNNDILIKNVRKLMEDNNMTQQQLADILDMSQSNVSKALSDTDKKCFTLDQVVGIAKHFNTSVDSLVGNYTARNRDISPRSVGEFLVKLIEHGDIQWFDHPIEEEIFKPVWTPQEGYDCKRSIETVNYTALFLPSYWHMPDDVTDEQAGELYAEMTQCGNDTLHCQTNKFLHQFLQIHAIYKQKSLEAETYQTVVADLLSHLRD